MTLILLLFSIGATQSHDAVLKQALQLLLDNKDAQAIALLDPLVAKNPNAADLHEMLATAHSASAEKLEGDATNAARRRTHLEAAATHFKRTIELTHVNVASNLGSLVEIYSPAGLNLPGPEETYARRLVDDHPTLTSGYAPLARVLAHSNRMTEAAAVLARARSTIEPDRQEFVATQLMEQVKLLPASATAAARLLLDEAMRIADALIAASPKKGEPVMFKSVVLETQANRVISDPARRTAMVAESKQLWERGRQLNAALHANDAPPLPPAPPVPPPIEARHREGVDLWDKVNRDPKMPANEARALLTQARAAFDEVLKANPEYMESLVFKSLVLRLEATRYEKDPERAKTLVAEADRLRDRAMEIQKRR